MKTASRRNRIRSGSGQQRMRPVDGCVQRLMPAHRYPRATREESESVVQAGEDVVERQRAHPRRRQFDGKGHSIEAAADLCDGAFVLIGDGEARPDPSGPIGEQLDRLIV